MQVKLILHVQNGPASDQINDPINLTEIQKMGYCRDLPHWVRHIPHRLRGGAVLNKLKLKGLAAFGAFPVQGLTGAGLPTALHEKSPAQSAELQFVCGEGGF